MIFKEVKLGECLTLINGRAYKQNELLDRGTPVLRIQNLNGGNNWYYSDLTLPDNKYCEDGDLLFAWSATFGPYKYIGPKSIYHYHIWKVLPIGNLIDKKFAYYTLLNITKKVKEEAHGISMLHITKSGMEALSIPLPPLATQQKIAAILDKADKVRQLNKQLIEKYDALTQSLFLDMFGDLVNNQKGWEMVEFGTIFNSLRYGTSTPPKYQNEGIPFIRATNVKNGNVEIKGMVYISEEEASKIDKCKLNEGDLIIVRSGANTGDCCRIPKQYQDAYGGFDIMITIDEPYSIFYNFLLNTKAGKAVLDPLTRRAGQPHLNSRQITELRVFKPPKELQNQFAERVQAIEHQKVQAQESLQKSEDLFNSLLQRAFKGELA